MYFRVAAVFLSCTFYIVGLSNASIYSVNFEQFTQWKSDRICSYNAAFIKNICHKMDTAYNEGNCQKMYVKMLNNQGSNEINPYNIVLCQSDNSISAPPKCVSFGEEDNLVTIFDYSIEHNEYVCSTGTLKLILTLFLHQFINWKSDRICANNPEQNAHQICSKLDANYKGTCEKMLVQTLDDEGYTDLDHYIIALCQYENMPPKCVSMGQQNNQIIAFDYESGNNRCLNAKLINLQTELIRTDDQQSGHSKL